MSSTISAPASIAVARVPLWINGQHTASQGTRHGVVTNPATGEEMQAILARVYATPKDLVARLAEASKSQPDLKVLNKP